MPTLNVTIVQTDLRWHDAAANLEHFGRIIGSLDSETDLVVLPEMFTTGFSMNAPELAEPSDGNSVRWMHEMASLTGAAVCGSLITTDGGRYYNRFVCAMPDGEQVAYDKRHLFRLADEHEHYTEGRELVTFTLKGFRVRPLVCYDLRFPVWSRSRDDYDVLVYVANWPNRRHHAWTTLLRARAIENLCYCVGVNRIGMDGNDLPYSGGSAIIDYLGHDLVDLGDSDATATAALDLDQLQRFRARFAFHEDADDFTLQT